MSTPVPGGEFDSDDFDNPVEEYHGEVTTVQTSPHQVVVTLDFIAAIGLYKLAGGGVLDADSEFVAAALQVQLAGIVGP